MSQSSNVIHNLYVGDTSNSFSRAVTQRDSTAVLIEQSNLLEFLNLNKDVATAYTSISDLGNYAWSEEFKQLLDHAVNITYIPPVKVDSSDTLNADDHTRLLLENYSSVSGRVIGLESVVDQYSKSFLHLQKPRLVETPQCWIVGCSNTNGIGYVDVGERYGDLIAKELNLPSVFLSKNATSIEWAADQILRSDIRKGDLIFWGITHNSRVAYHSRNSLINVTTTLYSTDKNLNQQVPIDTLDNFNRLYKNVQAVHQVNNVCRAIGASLFMLDILPNPVLKPFLYKLKNYQVGVEYCGKFVDFGYDGQHAGPKQHKEFAKKFLAMYYENK